MAEDSNESSLGKPGSWHQERRLTDRLPVGDRIRGEKFRIMGMIAQAESPHGMKTKPEIAQQLAEEIVDLRDKGIKDQLTGAWNRPYTTAMVAHEVNSRERRTSPLQLLFVDIDHFKLVNDAFGHETGDEVLKRLAVKLSELQEKFPGLTCGRWGGEEWVIIAPGYSVTETVEIALELGNWAHGNLGEAPGVDKQRRDKITLSMGLVEHRKGEDPKALVDRADKLMYKAKGNLVDEKGKIVGEDPEGRNRLMIEENDGSTRIVKFS